MAPILQADAVCLTSNIGMPANFSMVTTHAGMHNAAGDMSHGLRDRRLIVKEK